MMKKILFLAVWSILFIPFSQAKILRVNNNSGIQPVSGLTFTNLPDAVAAATAGDTIHIEGSVTPYTGNVSVNKKLVIIGPGYLLGYTAQTQYLKESAKLDCNITFEPGSEGSVLAGVEHKTGASGYSVLANPATSGTGFYAGNRVIVNADTVKIINSRLYFVQIENKYTAAGKTLNNISIQKCFFNPGVVSVTGAKTVANLSITNNFFRNDNSAAPATHYRVVIDGRGTGDVYPLSGARVSNNTFYGNFNVMMRNTLFANNAFFNSGTTNVEAHNSNTYTYNVMNVSVGGIADGINNNSIRSVGIEDWFSRSGSDLAIDIYYTSATNTTNCPLRDRDDPTSDSKERGMYGGGTPYVQSGMFRIPSVYDIVMDNEVGDQFDMTIRARVH